MNLGQLVASPLGPGVKSDDKLSRMLGSALGGVLDVLVVVGFPTTIEKVVVTDGLAVLLSSARFLSFLSSQSAASAGDNMIHPPFSDGYGDLLSTMRVSAGKEASAVAAKAWQTKQTAAAKMAVHDVLVEGIMSWLQDTGIKASATSPLYNNAEF